jgi:hypothetical protein
MTTSTRPAFQAKSINTDYESQVQTTLANGLLEYYLREKRLEIYLKRMVEYAVVMGSGFVKMDIVFPEVALNGSANYYKYILNNGDVLCQFRICEQN